MKIVFISLLVHFFSLLVTSTRIQASEANPFAYYGPWAHTYFMKGGLLHCSLNEKCIAPGKEDIEALKSDWETYEKVRMARIESVFDKVHLTAENILAIAQEALEKDNTSFFGTLYLNNGSKIRKKYEKLKMNELKMWISKQSPMYEKILELETLLNDFENRIESKEDSDLRKALRLLKNDRYRTWVNSNEFDNIRKEMVSIQRIYFPKTPTIRDEGKGSVREKVFQSDFILPLKSIIEFENCTNIESELKKRMGAIEFFNFDEIMIPSAVKKNNPKLLHPILDKDLIKFIVEGRGIGDTLKIECRRKTLLRKIEAKYIKNHRIVLYYDFSYGPGRTSN